MGVPPGSRRVTIMVVPHDGQRTYQFHVRVSFFRRLLALAVLVAAVLIGFLHSYSLMCANMGELARLREESKAQLSLLSSLSDRVAALRAREASVSSLEQQVRALIESDRFLPPHVKSQLLRLFPEVPPPSDDEVGGPPVPVPSEPTGAAGSQAAGQGGGVPVGEHSIPVRPRQGPLASRAMNRLWGVAGASRLPAPSIPDDAGGEAALQSLAPREDMAGSLAQAASSAHASAERLAVLQEVLERRLEVLNSLPQCMPTAGRYTSGFGFRRSPFGRGREFHSGVDLAAPRGTPVRAAADGVVLFSGYKPGLGKTVILDHGHGIQTLYGHQSRLLVQAGQWVSTGQVIGAVGDTGRSTGDHLHFELHFNGREVDPWPYLQRLGGNR